MKKVNRYVSPDGIEHKSERECREYEEGRQGRHHECPACNCTGTQRGEKIMGDVLNPDYGAFGGGYGDNEYRTGVVGYEVIPCDVCEGHGWTVNRKEPITEAAVIGFQDATDKP